MGVAMASGKGKDGVGEEGKQTTVSNQPSSGLRLPPAGLCNTCRYQRVVRNTRGSVFSMCERSRIDSSYPKYPRVPVLECAGWEQQTLS